MLRLTSGVYNEKAFRALDYIIARAGAYGIKLILTYGDQWNTADSKINYLEWGNATANTNLFFTSPTIQNFYKDHITTMVNRNVSALLTDCSWQMAGGSLQELYIIVTSIHVYVNSLCTHLRQVFIS